jgi:DNA-binding response OmpR family regulator
MGAAVNILLADDDYDDAFFFTEALKQSPRPINIITVKDGEQLMHYLNEHPEKLPFLIFLDLNMPRKNGLDCLREIKRNEKLKGLPVIIYSTSGEHEIISLLYKAGAQYYIQKPDDFSKLKKVVCKVISLGEEKLHKQPSQENFVIKP